MQGDENQHTAGKRNILRGSSRAGSATRRAFLRAVENYLLDTVGTYSEIMQGKLNKTLIFVTRSGKEKTGSKWWGQHLDS